MVRWTPPEEQRGAGDVLDAVTAVYVAMGTEAVRREGAPRSHAPSRARRPAGGDPLGDHRVRSDWAARCCACRWTQLVTS
jgi:hypothetical protein